MKATDHASLGSPPVQSIDDLRRIVERSRGSKRGRGAASKTMAVLADLLSRPGQAAVETITELAEYSNVDPSTLTRLGKKLGFKGFSQLQAIFRQYVAETQSRYGGYIHDSKHVKELLNASSGDLAEELKRQVELECQRIRATASQYEPASFERAVDLLVNAHRVYVLGLRISYGLAHYFTGYLQAMRSNTTLLAGPGLTVAGEFGNIGKNDVLLAISFRPYTNLTLKLVDEAKRSGIPIVAITDSGSPLEVSGPQGVTLRVDQPYYFDCSASVFVTLELLLLMLARRLGPIAVQGLAKNEEIARALDIES